MSHECNCQFCDKEISAENMATIVYGYITCGNLFCIRQAKENVKQNAREAAAKVEYKGRMVIFSTKTPEVDATWRPVAQKDHPLALENIEVMSQMKLGHFVFDEEEKVYYCAKTSLEAINQAKEKIDGTAANE